MPQDEAAFRRWYAEQARRYDLNPDPDAPDQFYDYRAAFRVGATPDATGHWPSDFKKPGHPNMVVGGFNVQTGERVPGTPRAPESELVRLGWDPQTAKRLSAMPEGQKVYLDDQGNELAAGGVYLDEQGNPIGEGPPAKSAREQLADRQMVRKVRHPDMLRPSTIEGGDPRPWETEVIDPIEYIGGTVANIPGSAVALVKSLPGVIARVGMAAIDPNPVQRVDLLKDIVSGYKERYGGARNIARTLHDDPVGMAADVYGGVKLAQAARPGVMRVARPAAQATATAARTTAAAVRPAMTMENAITTGAMLVDPTGFGPVALGGRLAAALWRRRSRAQPPAAAATTGQDVGRARPSTQPAATAQDALRQELAARDIDWRTTDAVPIDAITRDISRPGGSILEAGESRIGLGERLAEALGRAEKAKTPAAAEAALTEARRLAKAARQRMHIAEKQAR